MVLKRSQFGRGQVTGCVPYPVNLSSVVGDLVWRISPVFHGPHLARLRLLAAPSTGLDLPNPRPCATASGTPPRDWPAAVGAAD